MIATLLRISRTSLRRDRVAQVMTYVLPVAFFSIFALVFGRPIAGGPESIRVAVADEDRSFASRALVAALETDPLLRVADSTVAGAAPSVPFDRARAEAYVRGGGAPVAVVLPAGWGATFPRLDGGGMPAEVLADVSDPIASRLVVGLLQRAAAKVLRGDGLAGAAAPAESPALVPTRTVDVMRPRGEDSRMISFYAAGIAVMFLLFSCAAAGGALLDEQDSGTLERVLNTSAGMNGLLLGKWIHITLLGVSQIVVMFVWGMLVFHLDLLHHLPGFLVMTLTTAAAAAAFGLVLAAAARSRQQLSGLSTVLILTMSALGGSMFPRFLMSEGMQKLGLVTFNAWALDGYIKVFWRQAPLVELAPQVGVLLALTLVLLAVARLFARRWEAV